MNDFDRFQKKQESEIASLAFFAFGCFAPCFMNENSMVNYGLLYGMLVCFVASMTIYFVGCVLYRGR